jgi:nucleoside-diphosphate-sugar epimerase
LNNSIKKILVTGASGFIGKSLCSRLLREGCCITGTLLPAEPSVTLSVGVDPVIVEPLGPDTKWAKALSGVDTVIHLAARVHIMRESVADPIKMLRVTNTVGTHCLAQQAAEAGVRRFVFMSTIGVNGSESAQNKAFTELDEPNPHNPYSVSKFEAEKLLWQISSETRMQVVIIRAPLVYGPGNLGNFYSLLRAVSIGVPLPLASIHNLRSFLYVNNLADAITVCCTHPYAAGKTYMVSDDEVVTTPELIRLVAAAFNRPARLFPFPISLMRLAGRLTGKSAAVDRLLGSLVVDSSKIRLELGWKPPFTMEKGLRETADWYAIRSGSR